MKIDEIINESNKCLQCVKPKCQEACPLHNDIPQMIKNLKEGKIKEAYKINSTTNPMGTICGLICPHEKYCEGACVRGIKDSPVKIGVIENYICMQAINDKSNIKEDVLKNNNSINNRVAIIGGGPAGISCAYFLSHAGIQSTIFEKENFLGGILQYGIPNFRLDKEIVHMTINNILDANIGVVYNSILCNEEIITLRNDNETNDDYDVASTQPNYITIKQLKNQGYKYIFLATGLEKSIMLDIEGVNSNKVFSANEFLRKSEEEKISILKDKEVAIIGGGNVAIDCARTAKKYGKKSTIIYRRLKENMPANKFEIEEAENENVNFIFQKNVTKIIENDNNVITLVLDDKTNFKTNYLIMAIGSKINKEYYDKKILFDENNRIIVNENFETSISNVYAGGDITARNLTVANAIKSGRDVAERIAENIKKLHN